MPKQISTTSFPSPSDDYMEENLDFNEYLIKKPSATFIARASGQSMEQLGIHNGDLLIVDRSLNPEHNHIVVAVINGEFVCKILDKYQLQLKSANGHSPSISITESMDLLIEGVVTHSIRHHLPQP